MTKRKTRALQVLTIEAPPHIADALASHLFDRGLRGLEEQSIAGRVRLITYGDDRDPIEQYAALARAFLAGVANFDLAARETRVEITTRPNDDWSTSWMQYFQQTRLTARLVVQPSWDDRPAPPGLDKIVIEPKMAFGFGTHATTQLAAQAVERHCLAHPGGSMLDVGTGTGVLALVALKSGAARAVGIDLDPVAVGSAIENAALNGLTAQTEFSNQTLRAWRGAFDLVAANITAPALVELADELARLTASHGRLLLTGILPEGRREVAAAYDDYGLHVVHEEQLEGWCLLELTHT